MGLVSELRRRNVFRVAIAYIIIAWLILQVGDTLAPALHLGEWVNTALAFFLILGLPIALIFAWAFELTPEGLKKEKHVDRAESVTHVTGRKLDYLIIAVLVLALGYFSFDKFVFDASRDAELVRTTTEAVTEQVAETPDKSIAVLAFADLSPERDQEYFSDGISEELLNVLSKIPGLRVAARTSSFQFKGENRDIIDIGQQLNTAFVLEGSVRKAGLQVRITAQLIDAKSGFHLWSETYDRKLENIFALQDEVAQAVVKALKVTLLDVEEERLGQRYQPTLEAFEQLILGRYEMAKRTADGLAAAENHLKRAIELDPDYALALVALAETYDHQLIHSGLVYEESLQRRQPLIEKALQLDPFSGEAYTARAFLHISRASTRTYSEEYERDHMAAAEDFLKAIELNPSYARAHHGYSVLLRRQGRYEEGLARIKLAAELDPMAPIIQHSVADLTWLVGRAEEALTMLQRNIERSPEFAHNYWYMADYQTALGHVGVAQRWYQEARQRNPEGPRLWRDACLGLLNLGDASSAENCINRLREVHPRRLEPIRLRYHLQIFRDEWNPADLIEESLLEQSSRSRLADYIAWQGDIERARRIMADGSPELLEIGLELAAPDLRKALIFAAILHANGEIEQRDVLLLAMEERIATMHRTRGYGYGSLDVYIHAMRGDRDRAIAALREAIDGGWKAFMRPGTDSWWELRRDWKLGNLRQDPEFIAMVNELEADIRKQRQWYEENKDEPLF